MGFRVWDPRDLGVYENIKGIMGGSDMNAVTATLSCQQSKGTKQGKGGTFCGYIWFLHINRKRKVPKGPSVPAVHFCFTSHDMCTSKPSNVTSFRLAGFPGMADG